MKDTFHKIALVGKITDPEIREHLLALTRFLDERGVEVLVEAHTAAFFDVPGYKSFPLEEIGAHADMIVVLGGDGTMLTVARTLAEHDVPLVGVNRGRVGFLADITTETMVQKFAAILDGEYTREQRMLLGAYVVRNGHVMGGGRALNDVVISKTASVRLIELELHIDGEFVHRQRSDGLILATPTGTTAYALSAGGPLLHPTLEAIALVPISPHTLSNRPFAINSASKIEITLLQGDNARVHFDGQQYSDLHAGDKVVAQRLPGTVTLLHPRGHSHYAMLREKLRWG
ncbi:MAG: NAD kinase [Methylobacillus sp.]|jgi:NAD+ kinase|nr:NAD kinase [Methylobacillus sp.]